MSCEREAQVQAYYDDELPGELRSAVEAHLRECSDCTALLLELRTLTNSVRAAERAAMPTDAMKRLEQVWWRKRDRGVLRLAEVLTAAAAAVIFATLYFSSDRRDSAADPSPRAVAWQTEALMPPPASRDDNVAEVVAVAEWMANDLASDLGGGSR